MRGYDVTGVQTCALPIYLIFDRWPGLAEGQGFAQHQVYGGQGVGFPILVYFQFQFAVFLATGAADSAQYGQALFRPADPSHVEIDRKSVVQGKSVDLGGRRTIKKKNESTPLRSGLLL